MKAPKSIVIVTTSFPTLQDGSEAAGSFVADFANALSRHIKVFIVAPGTVEEIQKNHSAYKIYRFKAPAEPLSTLKPTHPKQAFKILKVLRSGQKMTHAAVANADHPHILALWALPSGYWAQKAVNKKSCDYSIWTLGSDIWSLEKIPLVRRYLRHVLQHASHCFADGIQLAADTSRISAREDVRFLPSTRQLSKPAKPEQKRTPPYSFAYLGRWHENKGVDILVDSLQQLDTKAWSNIKEIVIAGDGPLNQIIMPKIRALQHSGKPILAVGWLAKQASEELLHDSDFLIIPSRIESIPLVYSDAMKLHCPVIATPVGDLPSLVSNDKSGILAPSVTTEGLTEAITSALNTSPSAFSAGLSYAAGKFQLEHICKTFLDEIGFQEKAYSSNHAKQAKITRD